MKHKAKLTISRPQRSNGKRMISITVRDSDAGIEFLEIDISLESFAECITGLAYAECDIEFSGLENVGKQIERDTIEFEIPEYIYFGTRKEIAYKLAKETAPDGWIVSNYFGSQSSFFRKDGKDYARTSISRWVEKVEPSNLVEE